MAQTNSEKVALWRKRHPAAARKRRLKDNDLRRERQKKTGAERGRVKCGVSGCNRAGEGHHLGGRIVFRCRQHHVGTHKKAGTGPSTKGKASGRGPGGGKQRR
jgi:hypothetical protein